MAKTTCNSRVMETKYCLDCVNFRSLYKRAEYQFLLYKLGECFKQRQLVDRYGCCECWEGREKQVTVAPCVLKRAVRDLEEIKLLLREETERIEKK